MRSIDEFAKQAAAKFLDAQESAQGRFQLNLSGATVEHFIRCAYYASMFPDEGRWPRTTLMCYRDGVQFNVHVLFENSSEMTVEEIAKLSHGVAPDCHICCISKDGKLRISGLHITRPVERRDLGYSSFRVANPLKVSIIGPGHLAVSTGGIPLVYKAGDIFEESLLMHSRVMAELVSRVVKEMKTRALGTVENVEDVLNDLVKTIIKLGHGGLLLFSGTQKRSYFSLPRALTNPMFLDRPMYDLWESVKELLDSVGGQAGLPASVGEAKNSHSLIVAEKTELLEKSITAMAHLAGMDGAIAMDYECKVVAFNAIINKVPVDEKTFRFVDRDGRDLGTHGNIVKNRGSRHQSALSYVMSLPDSFAFVISQDGTVTAFHNKGENVIICDRGLRVME